MTKNSAIDEATDHHYDCFDIKYDITFHMTFGSKHNLEILMAFLNDILSLEGQAVIVDLSLNVTPATHDPGEKVTIYDIFATDKSGREFIVEMQLRKEPIAEMQLVYADGIATEMQISKKIARATANKALKKDYTDITKIIVVALLDYKSYAGNDDQYLSHYTLADIYSNREMEDANEHIFIELPKFRQTDITKLNSKIEMWLYLINTITTIRTLPEPFIDTVFAKVITILNKRTMSTETQSMILRAIERESAKTAQNESEK